MGILARLSSEIRAETPSEAFMRILRGPLGGPTASGVSVSPDSAMRQATVFACVQVVSEDIAKLPLVLYRRKKDRGKERAADHPLYPILHDRPNAWQTSFRFREMMQGHVELRGNAYALITRVRNQVSELVPLHPDKVSVKRADRMMLSYKVEGIEEPLPADRVLHLRGFSTDGIVGISRIGHAREAIGLAMAAERHGAKLFGNGAKMSGLLKHPGKFSSEDVARRVGESFDNAYGRDNTGRTAVLEEGMEYVKVGMTSEDAQFLETRKFQRSEIAALFRVPPHKIGDLERATFSNIEHQALEYVTDTLQGRVARWEQDLNETLLTPQERKTHFFKFQLEGLLRGDTKARYDAYHQAIADGWMSRNEVRELEDRNPEDGLDEFLQPLNMTAAGEADPPEPRSSDA